MLPRPEHLGLKPHQVGMALDSYQGAYFQLHYTIMSDHFDDTIFQTSDGRWLQSSYKEGSYYTAMTKEDRRRTGCHTKVSSSVDDAAAWTKTYSTKSNLLRALRNESPWLW